MKEEIKNGHTHNIDDILIKSYDEPAPSFLETEQKEPVHAEPKHEENEEKVTQAEAQKESAAESEKEESRPVEKDADVDEYGIEIKKPEKVYTEAQVQAMIRDRLSRVKSQQPEPQYQPQTQPAQQQTTDQDGDWQVQLESFIDNTLTKREKTLQEQKWQRQQQEAQAQFEVKFNEGAAKYADFETVVHDKPLTAQMVLATRGMNDPAAFIYAAAKTQPKELARIAEIRDPYSQAVEIGQLAEKMRKSRSTVSQAPRPIDTPKGDVVEKKDRTRNIDDKILADEKRIRQERIRR